MWLGATYSKMIIGVNLCKLPQQGKSKSNLIECGIVSTKNLVEKSFSEWPLGVRSYQLPEFELIGAQTNGIKTKKYVGFL